MRFGKLTLLLLFTICSLSARNIGPLLEPEARFLSTALVIKHRKKQDLVRRGIITPLGAQRWACFDTDLLRWAAIWHAPKGKPPISLDSMAAVSYPEGKAKAKRPPELRRELILSTPALPDSRPQLPTAAY